MVKFARRDLTAFTDLPQDVNGRCQTVVKVLGEMIVGSDTGWDYDERTPADTYIYVPSRNNELRFAVSYFRNESGAKLMVMAFIGSTSASPFDYANMPYFSFKNYLYPYEFRNKLESSDNSHIQQVGVMMSMIPAGSNSEFPNSIPNDYTTKFIPDDAIPLVTEAGYSSSGYFQNQYCFLGAVASNNIYSLGILIDSKFIMFMCGLSTTSTRATISPVYALGKIIGTLVHENDANICSHYGAIRFQRLKGEYFMFTRSLNGNNNNYYGRDISANSSSGSFDNNAYAVFFNENGELIPTRCAYGPYGVDVLSNAITNDSAANYTRWCPYVMTTLYDPVGNGVVPGDGFKGYLDTNLFRCAIGTTGNYYNDGAFVCVGGNMLVAWDQGASDNIM